jgi:hypothetical protein
LEIKRRGYASVLSVAAPFDSVTDADVLGAEDVVDVGIADVYDAFEVIFVGDIDGGSGAFERVRVRFLETADGGAVDRVDFVDDV